MKKRIQTMYTSIFKQAKNLINALKNLINALKNLINALKNLINALKNLINALKNAIVWSIILMKNRIQIMQNTTYRDVL